jgi:ribosomal protein L16/L10AE
MNETIPKKRDFLVPALPLIEEVADKAKATDVIEFLVKQRSGSTSTGPTYKVKARRFNEGTVSKWIAVRKSIKELWEQNNITSQPDRIANICSILQGESLIGFKEEIDKLTNVTLPDGTVTTIALDDVIVEAGLNAVAETIFPHRALETQKLWMRRGMKKSKELSFRKTASVLGRWNNCLPLTNVTLPDGTVTTIALDDVIVEAGLNAVAETIFPHRALETQKLWMRRGMKKSKELSFRKTASVLGRWNNCLPLFPGGSVLDKFSTTDIVELLEWSIPKAWRNKFNLDLYVPTLFGKD